MNNKARPDKLLRDLQSDDLTVLIPALDESVAPLREFTARLMEAIKDPDYGLFIAERFYQLMATAMAEIEKFQATTTEAEAKVNAAVLLLQLGSKSGVPCLLEAIEKNHSGSVWIAHKLADAEVAEAQETIITRLRRTELKKADELESFLAALSKLTGDLPLDLESRFLAEDAPDEVRSLIQARWLHHSIPSGQESQGDFLRV